MRQVADARGEAGARGRPRRSHMARRRCWLRQGGRGRGGGRACMPHAAPVARRGGVDAVGGGGHWGGGCGRVGFLRWGVRQGWECWGVAWGGRGGSGQTQAG